MADAKDFKPEEKAEDYHLDTKPGRQPSECVNSPLRLIPRRLSGCR